MKPKLVLAVVTATIVAATSAYAQNEGKGSAAKPGQMQHGGMGGMDF